MFPGPQLHYLFARYIILHCELTAIIHDKKKKKGIERKKNLTDCTEYLYRRGFSCMTTAAVVSDWVLDSSENYETI